MSWLRIVFSWAIVFCVTTACDAELQTEQVTYTHGAARLIGYLAYDDALEGPRPAVLLVHEWWGVNDYAKFKAREVAELGYVVLALDMYGKGQVFKDREGASTLAGQFYGKPLMAERAQAGLNALAKNSRVDPKRIVAMGYCFGGTVALELAYSGADLRGVVSFHGGLTPPGDDARIKGKVLVCHGEADPLVSAEQLSQFKQAMDASGAQWELVSYPGAMHAFTNPRSDQDTSDETAYDEKADQDSWRRMVELLEQVLAEPEAPSE